MLWIDFETKSRCDLPTHGAYVYARDPSTQPLCMGWAFDDEPVEMWVPPAPFPDRISEHIRAGGQLVAHSAQFDRLILTTVVCPDYGVPKPKLEQWICSAAIARANAMPGNLEDLGRAMRSDMRKSYRGAALIRALSIPRPDGTFNDDPVLHQEMRDYCRADVEAMRHMVKRLRSLPPEELADFHVNERINDRGVMVDVEVAIAAQRYAAEELREIEAEVVQWTEGAITKVRSPKLRQWIWDRVGDEARRLMVKHKDGERKVSIAKDVRANLLLLSDESPDEVPDYVAQVIQCASDLWASSIAKFQRMADVADPDDHRARGSFVLNGGSQTGRYASHGTQVHNFPRKSAKDPEALRKLMLSAAEIPQPVTGTLKEMLRPSLMAAPGHTYIISDWSAIEARALPWLAKAEEKLDIFRRREDPYLAEASNIFHRQVTDENDPARQIGKVAVLSLGFGGSVKAFGAMARNYNTYVPEDEALQVVKAWRRANQWCTQFWSSLDSASRKAMRRPETPFEVGRLIYYYDKSTLWVLMPCGRPLAYPQAKFEATRHGDEISYLKASWTPAADDDTWPRARLWPGLLAEGPTQGICASLLRYSLRECDSVGLPVVLHCHDEIVIEVPDRDVDKAKSMLHDIMTTPPPWADGFPLDVKMSVSKRYTK